MTPVRPGEMGGDITQMCPSDHDRCAEFGRPIYTGGVRRTFSESDFDESRPAAEPTGSTRAHPAPTRLETERWPEQPAEQTLPDQPAVTWQQPAISYPSPPRWNPPPVVPQPTPQPARRPAEQPVVERRPWPEPGPEPVRPRRRSGALGFVSLTLSMLVMGGFLAGGLRAGRQIEQLLRWGYQALGTGTVPVELLTAGKAFAVLCGAGVVSFVVGNVAVGTRRGKLSGTMGITFSMLAPFAGLLVFAAAALGLLNNF